MKKILSIIVVVISVFIIALLFGHYSDQKKDQARSRSEWALKTIQSASTALTTGRTNDAVQLLRLLKPDDPNYKFAQELLWIHTEGKEGIAPPPEREPAYLERSAENYKMNRDAVSKPVERKEKNYELIGRWRDNSIPQIASVLVLYKEDGRYYLNFSFDQGGSSATHKLHKEKATKGTQQYRRTSHPGDYYVITIDNNLESWDSKGLICTAYPIK